MTGRVGNFIRWWFRGAVVAKPLKIFALAGILYTCFAFACLRSPAISGVVVDIDTNQPVQGAVVLKYAYGPALVYSESPSGGLSGGADAKGVTSQTGHFSFPGEILGPIPIRVINTVDIRVWQKEYIGVLSNKEGMWWTEEKPRRSDGYCKVERHRDWLGRFNYRVSLRKALTEEEWRVKIASTNLGVNQEFEQRRLFEDFSGYPQRWPEGERAEEYLGRAMRVALVAHERVKTPGSADLARFLAEDRSLLDLARRVPRSTKRNGYDLDGVEENLPLVAKEYNQLRTSHDMELGR